MLKNQKCINEFSEIRHNPDISDDQLEVLQTCIYDAYVHKSDGVKLLRYKLCSSRQGKVEAASIPSWFDKLELQSKRAA